MSNLSNYSASFKMKDWAQFDSPFHKKYIDNMTDIIINIINDGEIEISVDKLGYGTIDVNQTNMSKANFHNYMKQFSQRFHFSVLDVQG